MVTDERTEIRLFQAMKRLVVPLVVVCGWCADSERETAEAERRGATVTHGMCPVCAGRFFDLAAK